MLAVQLLQYYSCYCISSASGAVVAASQDSCCCCDSIPSYCSAVFTELKVSSAVVTVLQASGAFVTVLQATIGAHCCYCITG